MKKFCIGCRDLNSNVVGCFVYETCYPFHAISPVFDSLVDLVRWMKTQNWKAREDIVSYSVITDTNE